MTRWSKITLVLLFHIASTCNVIWFERDLILTYSKLLMRNHGLNTLQLTVYFNMSVAVAYCFNSRVHAKLYSDFQNNTIMISYSLTFRHHQCEV